MIAEAMKQASAQQSKRTSQFHKFQERYENDATGFVRECIDWNIVGASSPTHGPTAYQEEILGYVPREHRVSVRGPHGLGKSSLLAWFVHWFALTRDGKDWKCVTTASAWRQLKNYLWPEIHKWSRYILWDKVGRPRYTSDELLTLSLRLQTGEAFAVASDNPELIEGAHADHILYIFDESKAVLAATFDAAEGALASGGGDIEGVESYALAFSTPGDTAGRFYEIHNRSPGLEDWRTRHVRKEEVIAAGRISAQWAENRRRQWGEMSQVYQNRVEGEFFSDTEEVVIPLAYVEAANERWRDYMDAGKTAKFVSFGVDVGRGGDASTIAGFNADYVVPNIFEDSNKDTMTIAGQTSIRLRRSADSVAVVDVIGVGAGVVDRLREQFAHERIVAFNASEGTYLTDESGEIGFVDWRSAAWWRMRELLSPESEIPIALPPDDELTGELVAPKWDVTSGGKIKVESKQDIRKRLGRSTNKADAVIQAISGKLLNEQTVSIVSLSSVSI
jgi:hypothetical protein